MRSNVPEPLVKLLTAPAATGDDAAWSEFLHAYSQLMLQASRPFSHEYDDTMDRYLFVVEHLRRDNYARLRRYAPQPGSEFVHWLLVVTRRLCLDYHRHRYGRPRKASTAARAARHRLVDLRGSHVEPGLLAATDGPRPDADLHMAERVRVLREAVRELAPRDQLLLKLRFEDELEARAIAERLGLSSPFDVYRRLRAVLNTVRRTLQDRGVRHGDL